MTRQNLSFTPMSAIKNAKKPSAPNTVALAANFSTEFHREISPAMVRRLGRRIGISYARGYGQGHLYTASEIAEIRKLLKEGGLRVIAARARKGVRLPRPQAEKKPAIKPAAKKAPEPKLSAAQKSKAQAAASTMKAPVKKA